MKNTIFWRREQLFLPLLAISVGTISYSIYKVIGLMIGLKTLSLVRILKSMALELYT
tara:strand:- start:12122 stop:12292 length:171 start_codon:yes stop_codon:yes gene_type:complete